MKPESDNIVIKDIPWFSLLTDEEKLSVQKDSFNVSYIGGDVIFKQGTPVSYIMYVQSGLVKIYKEIEVGKEIIFSLKVITKLFNQSQKQLPGRVAEMLLYFSEEIYNSPKFRLPLSRRELADFVGTTKESMIRTLAEFRHDRIIELDDKQVEILSYEAITILSKHG